MYNIHSASLVCVIWCNSGMCAQWGSATYIYIICKTDSLFCVSFDKETATLRLLLIAGTNFSEFSGDQKNLCALIIVRRKEISLK